MNLPDWFVVNHQPDLGGLYVKLRDLGGEDGRCHPSQKWLAQYQKVSTRTIRRRLTALLRLGLLRRIRTGKRRANSYVMVRDCPLLTVRQQQAFPFPPPAPYPGLLDAPPAPPPLEPPRLPAPPLAPWQSMPFCLSLGGTIAYALGLPVPVAAPAPASPARPSRQPDPAPVAEPAAGYFHQACLLSEVRYFRSSLPGILERTRDELQAVCGSVAAAQRVVTYIRDIERAYHPGLIQEVHAKLQAWDRASAAPEAPAPEVVPDCRRCYDLGMVSVGIGDEMEGRFCECAAGQEKQHKGWLEDYNYDPGSYRYYAAAFRAAGHTPPPRRPPGIARNGKGEWNAVSVAHWKRK